MHRFGEKRYLKLKMFQTTTTTSKEGISKKTILVSLKTMADSL